MVCEIESEMPNSEMLEWAAYFKIKQEAEKAEYDKAKNAPKVRRM
jgi:hypothetical protein